MSQTRTLALVLLLALAAEAWADMPRGTGGQTGDGSTAFTGLAGTPEANLFVGAASTAIPIEVPPGRRLVTPRLALVYNSQAGPSPYGYGWDLPLGRVQRSTKRGLGGCTEPHQNDYVLVLPGSTVECTLDANQNCQPKVQEAFLRIKLTANPEPGTSGTTWEVWDKTGLHYYFGTKPGSKMGKDPSSSNACSVHSWSLTAIEDPNGNRMDITYDGSDTSGTPHPMTVQYGKNAAAGMSNHLFEVRFSWSSIPDGKDRVVNGLGGAKAQITKLLSSIEVRYLDPVTPRLIRSYALTYDAEDERVARRSFLLQVMLRDGTGQPLRNVAAQPASAVFAYDEHTPTNGRLGFGDPHYDLAPGAPAGGTPDYWGLRRTESDAGNNQYGRIDVLDLNGDGRIDHVGADEGPCAPTRWTVYPGEAEGGGFSATHTCWYLPPRARRR